MARLAPDNSATRAVNRTAALRVLAAWDVAGDASEHAGSRWGAGERFARGKPKPLGTVLRVLQLEKAPRQGLMGKTAEHFERQALHLIQREPVERGGIAIQNQDADVGSGRLMQDFY